MSGGLFITRKELPYSIAEPLGLTLMSDLHIGGATTDHEAILSDLNEADTNGDRVNLNGDIFDCIVPKDHKRFRPDALHPDIQGRADVLDAQLEMGYEMLKKYAHLIDMAGMGNHDRAAEVFHATDLVARLVRRLNKSNSKKKILVKYGGYTGFIVYKMSRKSNSARVVIHYHHGSGGQAPVTKGMIGFHRKATWVDSDIVWEGHKHNTIVDTTPIRMRCPLQGDDPVMDQQVFIMTGGYMDTYKGQSHEDVMEHGRMSSYASDWGLPPQKKGGVRVLVKFKNSCGIDKIRVIS